MCKFVYIVRTDQNPLGSCQPFSILYILWWQQVQPLIGLPMDSIAQLRSSIPKVVNSIPTSWSGFFSLHAHCGYYPKVTPQERPQNTGSSQWRIVLRLACQEAISPYSKIFQKSAADCIHEIPPGTAYTEKTLLWTRKFSVQNVDLKFPFF